MNYIIIAAVFVVILTLLALLFMVVLYCRKKKEARKLSSWKDVPRILVLHRELSSRKSFQILSFIEQDVLRNSKLHRELSSRKSFQILSLKDVEKSLASTPIPFRYKDLEVATNNFSVKLGHGSFGSVYKGVLPDGTHVAVKKLEGTRQGKKQFRAEVGTIGSIHHHNLVRLKGFCSDGTHMLLVYPLMANKSLDKWIFKKNKMNQSEFVLDWNTRFNIALGSAKGLAYLHQDCDSKILHCDIKPENVLLDDHFIAKVSDFGLAKLMNREQSHVFTTLRGTLGYLAPEWIKNQAISDKTDVYSYGMMLLEIISGRRNYVFDPISEKSDFPCFAFKMMEEGKMRDIIDSEMKIDDENDDRVHRAISVALWCIQHDMSNRPSMTKVVQMLEGLCTVPKPPKPFNEGYASSSNAYLSAVSLLSV